jgi:hypothetical protein
VGNIDVGKKLNKLFGILFYSSLLYVPIIYLSANSDITTLFIRVFRLTPYGQELFSICGLSPRLCQA